MTNPDTPLDEYADRLEDVRESRESHLGSLSTHYTDVSEWLDDGFAVTLPFHLYGAEFQIFATAWDDRRNGLSIRAYAFHPDVDLTMLDETPSRANTITSKYLTTNKLHDDEPSDDMAHLLATVLGYFTRYVLDGRDYGGWRAHHDDPELDEVA